jgi:hypothetical protein
MSARPMRIAKSDNTKANPLRLLGLIKVSSKPKIKFNTFFDVSVSSFLSSLYTKIHNDMKDTRPIKNRTTPTNNHIKNLSFFLTSIILQLHHLSIIFSYGLMNYPAPLAQKQKGCRNSRSLN